MRIDNIAPNDKRRTNKKPQKAKPNGVHWVPLGHPPTRCEHTTPLAQELGQLSLLTPESDFRNAFGRHSATNSGVIARVSQSLETNAASSC